MDMLSDLSFCLFSGPRLRWICEDKSPSSCVSFSPFQICTEFFVFVPVAEHDLDIAVTVHIYTLDQRLRHFSGQSRYGETEWVFPLFRCTRSLERE